MTLPLDERMALMPGVSARRIIEDMGWLGRELIATEPAKERLKRWVDAGCPVPDRTALTYIGDSGIEKIVEEAMLQIPDPVAAHLVDSSVVIGVGRSSAGWHTLLPVLPTSPFEARHVIAIDGGESDSWIAGTFAHEGCHSWLNAIVSPDAAPTRADRREIDQALAVAIATDPKIVALLAPPKERAERQAAILARSWGFKGAATNPRYCSYSQHIQRKIRSEV